MNLLEKYLQPLREGEGAGAGAATVPPPATPPPPWHQGLDPLILGHWQNKNYDLGDPIKVALEATKQAMSAERHFGVPPDQIIKLPKDTADEAGWKAVYGRLGVPSEAKDYDLTGIKYADGRDLDPAFTDAMRASLLAARVPKDRAADVVKSVVKVEDDRNTAAAAEKAVKLEAERSDLRRNWGQNFDRNKLTAMEGARRLGADPEVVARMEQDFGYAKTMEIFRRAGAGTSEDVLHEGMRGGNGLPATREGAADRLAQLERDPAWGKRVISGDAAAVREYDYLTKMKIGFTDAA